MHSGPTPAVRRGPRRKTDRPRLALLIDTYQPELKSQAPPPPRLLISMQVCPPCPTDPELEILCTYILGALNFVFLLVLLGAVPQGSFPRHGQTLRNSSTSGVCHRRVTLQGRLRHLRLACKSCSSARLWQILRHFSEFGRSFSAEQQKSTSRDAFLLLNVKRA